MQATPAEIARRALADHLAALPPAELLGRYATRRDPEAFAGLVQQFGPMVFGVCRRVLGSSADADDAFQAVFLALARQADSFRDAQALPAWLHRVALRVSHKALARRAVVSESPEAVPDPSDPLADVAWKDVRRVLDEELDALPDKFRGPVVLCWLDGLTQDQAAGRLSVSLATLKRRLESGRELLRARLTSRGLAPVVVAAAVLDPTGLRAVLPEALTVLAVELGVPDAAVPAGVEALRVAVAVMGQGKSYLKVGLALVLVGGVAMAGAIGLNAFRAPPPKPQEEPMVVQLDGPEEPLPAGAVARFGTTRFRVPAEIRTSLKPSSLTRDGRLIAIAAGYPFYSPESGSISVYETATWKLVFRARDHFPMAGPVFISPDGRSVTYKLDPEILGRLMRDPRGTIIANPQVQNLRWMEGHNLQFLDCRFSTNPPQLPAVGNGPRGRLNEKWVRPGPGLQTGLMGFTDDGQFMVAGVGCIDPTSGEVIRPLPAGVWDGTPAHLGEPGAGRTNPPAFAAPEPPRRHGTPAPDATLVAEVSGDGGNVSVWQAAPWSRVAAFTAPAKPHPDFPAAWIAEDNKSVALALANGDIARWEIETGRALPRLVAGAGPALDRGYHVLPGGQQILTPCSTGVIRIWDAATGQEILVPGSYTGEIQAWPSEDGAFVVVADGSGKIELLDATTGRAITALRLAGAPAGLPAESRGTASGFVGKGWFEATPGGLAGRYPGAVPELVRVQNPENGRAVRLVPHGGSFPGLAHPFTYKKNPALGWWVRYSDGAEEQCSNFIGEAAVSPNGKAFLVVGAQGIQWGNLPHRVWSLYDFNMDKFDRGKLPLPADTRYAWFTPDGRGLITFGTTVGYRWDIEKLIAAQKK